MSFNVERKDSGIIFRPKAPFKTEGINTVVAVDPTGVRKVEGRHAASIFPTSTLTEKRHSASEQAYATLIPEEITYGITRVLGLPDNFRVSNRHKVEVPAAYMGRFAKVLASLGFSVTASDIQESWASWIREEGITAFARPAQFIPRDKQNPRFATIAFEPYPVASRGTGWLFFLRESLNTQHGVICVESLSPHSITAGVTFNDLEKWFVGKRDSMFIRETLVRPYLILSKVYGIATKVIDTNSLRFTAHTLTEEARNRMAFDLRLNYYLARLIRNNGSGPLKLSIADLANNFRVDPEQVFQSIGRIEYAIFKLASDHTSLNGWENVVHALAVPQSPSEQTYFLYERGPNGNILYPSGIESLLKKLGFRRNK